MRGSTLLAATSPVGVRGGVTTAGPGHHHPESTSRLPSRNPHRCVRVGRVSVLLFLPAAKRQGHAELWVEKKRKGLMGFETLKPLFLVLFGIILSSYEPV